MSEYIYTLKSPFSYARKGENVEAEFITLTAPNFKQLPLSAPIKQAFMTAITEVHDSADSTTATETPEKADDDDSGLTAGGVLQVLYRSSCDMVKILLHAEQLFKSGTALVDGEVKLTTPLMEKMQGDDFERLLGAYVANFIAPSLMDGQ